MSEDHHSPSPGQPGPLGRALARAAVGLIRLYQHTLGHIIGGHCRFHPSCSHYAVEAFRTHPVHRATWLTLRRLLRCHPFGGHGFDPVPPARAGRQDRQNR